MLVADDTRVTAAPGASVTPAVVPGMLLKAMHTWTQGRGRAAAGNHQPETLGWVLRMPKAQQVLFEVPVPAKKHEVEASATTVVVE